MIPAKLTVTKPARGVVDDGRGNPWTLIPGVYDLEQIDGGELWVIVDEVPEVCVVVTLAALGLVECPACDGRGEFSYRVSEDEWESDWCGECEGIGGVPKFKAAQVVAMMDEARSGMYP